MRKFWIVISVCWLWTCGGGGGKSTGPVEPPTINPPTVSDVTINTNEDIPATFNFLGSDPQNLVLTYSQLSDPEHGIITISGSAGTYTPTANYNGSDTFTYSATNGTNSSGSATVNINIIAVNDEPPSISYPNPSYIFTKDQTIATIHATATGGLATSWEVSDLPAGLSIDAVDGYIWGIATSVTPTTTYTVWANNSGGSASTTITMTVNDIPPSISYSGSPYILTKGTPATITPTNTGGTAISWIMGGTLKIWIIAMGATNKSCYLLC